MPTTFEQTLEALDQLVGEWTTQATHPALPGVVVQGTAVIEWLEGKRFLIQRARTDHPDFPDSISVIGFTDRDRVDDAATPAPDTDESQLHMHYFDSRGVFRVYDAGIDAEAWRLWRTAPGFSQRFTGALPDRDTILGLWQANEADALWKDDLQITYRRRR
jgi:hypothetical protein